MSTDVCGSDVVLMFYAHMYTLAEQHRTRAVMRQRGHVL